MDIDLRCRTMANRMWADVDPYEDWKHGLGGLLRLRVLAVFALFDAGGLNWLWNNEGPVLTVELFAATLPLIAVVLFLRHHWIKGLQTGISFHAACHNIRDLAANLDQIFAGGRTDEYRAQYGLVHDAFANRIADYFRSATRDTTVNCAIRLARTADSGTIEYATKGRSDGMNPNRKGVSTPIPSDKGLARRLTDNGELGVCQVDNIKDAIANGWWMPCKSDGFPDVRYLLVAPINWYRTDGTKVMGGILYVTSRRNNLTPHHVEPTKAFADLLGIVYPSITGVFIA